MPSGGRFLWGTESGLMWQILSREGRLEAREWQQILFLGIMVILESQPASHLLLEGAKLPWEF
jgi:hypothetical protein